MNWEWIAQFIEVALSLFLIGRLLSLHLHKIYSVFCAFLIADISGSLLWLTEHCLYYLSPAARPHIDYRLGWLGGKIAVWILTIWTLYMLLGAILTNFHGIDRLARKVLKISFAAAILAGFASTIGEYQALGLSGSAAPVDPINKMLGIALIFDRAICSVALLVLLIILSFLLWFPVEISRNLAVFSAGFVVYFAAKTSLLLGRSFWSHDSTRIVSMAITIAMSLCVAYWALFISRAGERVKVRPGHAWEPAQQELLIVKLEALNASLLRAARR